MRQALRRLPSKYHKKWAEYCFKLRKNKEPSLCDLETWLQERILTAQEACIPTRERLRKTQGQDGKNRSVGKTSFVKLKCILFKNKHLFYKCDKYEEMTGTESMKLVKKGKLCFNYLKGNHNADKCSSKDKCFRPGCAEHHHTSLHDYFKKKIKDTDKEDTKVCMSKTAKHQAAFLQIAPVKVKSKGGRFISTFALLDSGSESTLVRAEFLKRLDLEGKTKLANISSIKDTGETIRVKTIKPQIVDPGNTSIFHIGGALSTEKEKFNMPSQHPLLGFHSDDKWTCIRNLKLNDVNPSKVTLVIGADPEALMQ